LGGRLFYRGAYTPQEQGMIAVTCQITAKEGQEVALKSALMAQIIACKHHAGLLLYSIHQNTAHTGSFIFYEQWESREHLDAHLSSPELRAFRERTLPLMENRRIDIWDMLAHEPR
jgi:quinol monooxygenase YgiN